MFTSSDAACETVQGSLDSYVSNELGEAARKAVRLHLDACHACAGLVEERVRVRHLVQRAVRRETPDAGLERRIRESIRES